MLEVQFEKLYLWFRANYYRRMVQAIGTRTGSLSATESFCVEIIYLLGRPTISQFAAYLGISVPNANYKINSLVQKGYVVRTASEKDQRQTLLAVTDKFLRYYGLNDADTARLMRRIREDFSDEELHQLENGISHILDLIAQDSAAGGVMPLPTAQSGHTAPHTQEGKP